jgi:hypothetical protein
MKKLLTILATVATLGLSMAAGTAFAADAAPAAAAPTTQQSKMKTCNVDAKTKALKGDERKAFMKECLGAKPAAAEGAAGMSTQQNKMKTCNADAKTKALKGAERKTFMKECLSAK